MSVETRARKSGREEGRVGARVHPIVWLAPAAVLLRLVVFLGRGDFVAFDESWYLLLGRNLWAGDGYTLTGLRHTALSPLFPVLAGALDLVVGDIVWAGRIVAAVAAGALVVPCWSIFRRLAGRRTALLGCVLVAVLPSLAPFAAPYWVGWDLWMGPEPVYHFFLFAGIALVLRGFEHGRPRTWLLAGAAFALAYTARPEALIVGGLLGLAALAVPLLRREARMLARPALMVVGLAVVAAPYWVYLHDTLGRWTLSGRFVRAPAAVAAQPVDRAPESGSGDFADRGSDVAPPPGDAVDGDEAGRRADDGSGGSAAVLENMIWRGEQDSYVETLYALDASGERLANSYWGVPRRVAGETSGGGGASTAGPRGVGRAVRPSVGEPDLAVEPESERADRAAEPDSGAAERADSATGSAAGVPDRLARYVRALGIALPGYLWVFAAIGLLTPRRRPRRAELLAAVPLAVASLLIARVVAVDPRTQLFLAPMLAFYTARGLRRLGVAVDRGVRGASVRRGLVPALLIVGTVGVLLFRNARTLYVSVTRGSPHHTLGAYSRMLGSALRPAVGEDGTIMSWDPAVALYAGRDWRVLPYAPFDDVVRYARASGSGHILLADYYPAPGFTDDVPGRHLVVRVPPGGSTAAGSWRIDLVDRSETHMTGVLRPTDDDADAGG